MGRLAAVPELVRESDRARLAERDPPRWWDPMNATLTERRFSDPNWLFERKFDGERCLGYRTGGQVRLLTRNRLDAGSHYPEVVEALAEQPEGDYVVDGEVVAFDGNVTSFARLQQRMKLSDPEQARRTGIAVYYYLFDLLYADGYDVRRLPLRERKRILRRLFSYQDPLRFTTHRNATWSSSTHRRCLPNPTFSASKD